MVSLDDVALAVLSVDDSTVVQFSALTTAWAEASATAVTAPATVLKVPLTASTICDLIEVV